MEKITEMLKGILEGLVLEIISQEETYGYEITKKLNNYGFNDIVEGTVYTVLLRLEKNQLVNIEKKQSDKGPSRKFYTLNKSGYQELELFWQKWNFITEKINIIKNEV
ncbi:PadR family transcriptional regulator [Mycoplasma sp. P36-A1]|uniref:PadR family transcriptional regulator n=1 Tax=Mycoplasma sp. P36-A1 TaxID=3252900 RepID=UPI003C2C27EC